MNEPLILVEVAIAVFVMKGLFSECFTAPSHWSRLGLNEQVDRFDYVSDANIS